MSVEARDQGYGDLANQNELQLSSESEVEVKYIPQGQVLRYLKLQERVPIEVVSSVLTSDWYEIDQGRHLLEVKNRQIRDKGKGDFTYVCDFDDTLCGTSKWHEREYAVVQNFFEQKEFNIDLGTIKSLYEMAKITVPGKAEVLKRYTPQVNLVLLTQLRKSMMYDQFTLDEALTYTAESAAKIEEQITRWPKRGEEVIYDYNFDEDLLSVMVKNSISRFVYTDLVSDIFSWDESDAVLRILSAEADASSAVGTHYQNKGNLKLDNDIRLVVTRGKVEGPLGQVHKVHDSGIMRLPSVDAVIYTNDVKVVPLITLSKIPRFLPKNIFERQILVYDDNPSEITQFYPDIYRAGIPLRNIELVHVRPADSKRRNKAVELKVNGTSRTIIPDVENATDIPPELLGQLTICDHYLPVETAHSKVV